MIGFALLGPLEARRAGHPLPLGGTKQRAVLALLLLHANEVVSTDRLVEELWGGAPPAGAVKALQVHISRLRRSLGEAGALLETRPPGYVLHTEPERLDLQCFERLVERAKQARARGEREAAAGLLREALALWRGPPLADLQYEPFAQVECGRLEELRLAALEERLDLEVELRRHAEAIPDLEALVAWHPPRERALALLMLALYRAGRQVEALDVYRAARRRLVEELGIEPGEDLRRLEQAILTQDSSLAGEAAPGPQAPSPRREFVGREEELALLLAGLEEARAGEGSIFLLAGEPGIGKSSLADELARQARGRGARVAWGRCWEAGGAPAYWPWVQALRGLVRDRRPDELHEDLGPGGADVAQLIPELQEEFPSAAAHEERDPEAARFRLFDSTSGFLRRASVRQPLVLILDDLHVADAPSLLLLRFLGGELVATRLLVVGAYRDVEVGADHPLKATLAELSRTQRARRLRLPGFQRDEVAAFIWVTTGVAPPDEVAVAIHSKTEGNPLFVVETVRLLASEQALADAGAVAASGVPEGVREAIDRRLVGLGPDCQRALGLAAVLGREFDVDPLEHMADLPREELLAHLDDAVGARLVSQVPGGVGRLRFSHALVRDVLYEGLPVSQRARLHRAAGEALEALYGADPEPHLAELGHHFFRAGSDGDPEKALAYARRAAERAVLLLAHEEAARLYRLALEVLDRVRPGDAAERAELLLSLGHAQAGAGQAAEAKDTFLLAADLATEHELPEAPARAALGYGGRYVWMAARGDRHLVPLLERALATLPEGDSVLRVRCMARLAGALRDQPSRDRRAGLSQAALKMARRVGDTSTLAYALDARCTAMAAPDHAHEQFAIATEAVHLAEQAGAPERVFFGHIYRLLALFDLGDIAGVSAALDASGRIADDLREPAYRWGVEVVRAELALFEGRFDAAEELMEGAFALGRRSQSWNAEIAYLLQRFQLCKHRGGLDGLAEPLRRAAEENPTYPILRSALASLYAELGWELEARAAFEGLAPNAFEALPFNEEWLVGLGLLAEVARFLADTERAHRLYGLLLPYADRNAVAYPEISTGSVHRPLGLLAATVGRRADSERHFEAALGHNIAMGAHPWTAQSAHDWAAVLLEDGDVDDRRRAGELLARARETYGRLGMSAHERRAAALAADADASPRRT